MNDTPLRIVSRAHNILGTKATQCPECGLPSLGGRALCAGHQPHVVAPNLPNEEIISGFQPTTLQGVYDAIMRNRTGEVCAILMHSTFYARMKRQGMIDDNGGPSQDRPHMFMLPVILHDRTVPINPGVLLVPTELAGGLAA